MLPAARMLVGVLLVATTAACGGSSAGPGVEPTSPSGSDATANPAALVGSWYLDAPGEAAGTMLVVGDRQTGLAMFRPCGMLFGSWAANRHALFVGQIDGGDMSCHMTGGDDPAKWLADVVGFRITDNGAALLAADGSTVASLTPGAHPSSGPNDSPDYASPPVVTPDMRKRWAEPAPLPDGVRAAAPADVLGTWVPVDDPNSRALVTFKADGSYTGSDGCNGVAGRYAVGDGGVVVATSGPQTLIGCDNSPLPGWVTESGRLGIRDGRLVFVAPDGNVLGEASPQP